MSHNSTAAEGADGPVLLYDGECGFCSSSMQFILRHEKDHTLRFAALQGAFGRAAIERHPQLQGVDSAVWLEPASARGPERAHVRSDAMLRIAAYLGGFWRVAAAGHLLPRSLRDMAYDFVARHRHHLPGTTAECLVPTPAVRERFIA